MSWSETLKSQGYKKVAIRCSVRHYCLVSICLIFAYLFYLRRTGKLIVRLLFVLAERFAESMCSDVENEIQKAGSEADSDTSAAAQGNGDEAKKEEQEEKFEEAKDEKKGDEDNSNKNKDENDDEGKEDKKDKDENEEGKEKEVLVSVPCSISKFPLTYTFARIVLNAS